VVLSDTTQRLIQGRFVMEGLGRRTLKGIREPVLAHRAVAVRDQSRFEAAASRGLTTMSGRESELALLMQRWEQAGPGRIRGSRNPHKGAGIGNRVWPLIPTFHGIGRIHWVIRHRLSLRLSLACRAILSALDNDCHLPNKKRRCYYEWL